MKTYTNTDAKYGDIEVFIDDYHNQKYIIFVNENDGNIPHFHLYSNQTQQDCSICILEPKYYKHSHVVQILDDYDVEIINRFLSSKYKNGSYWDHILSLWNIANDDIYEGYTQPDYTQLSEKTIKRRTLWQTIVSKWKA